MRRKASSQKKHCTKHWCNHRRCHLLRRSARWYRTPSYRMQRSRLQIRTRLPSRNGFPTLCSGWKKAGVAHRGLG